MNKIVVSLGLAAIGASGLQTVCAGDLESPSSKIWNVSASLRGFYDDNINTAPEGPNKIESFGIEVKPSVGLNWNKEGTSVSFNYDYSFKYYDQTPAGQTQNYNQTHIVSAILQHDFGSRYHLGVSDSFAIGQEPDVLRAPNAFVSPQYISGDNIRNYGSINFSAEFTPVFSVQAAYNNGYYNYADEFSATQNPGGSPVTPSNSGLLDRIEHTPNLEAHYRIRPQTTTLVGYQFSLIDYTADEPITGVNNPGEFQTSDSRNSRSHYIYGGILHTFRPELDGAIRAGAQFIEFYNDPTDESEVSPYVVASLTYHYTPESHFDVGFRQSRNPTDVAGSNDADTTMVYGSLTHQITPRLTGNVIFTFQNSMYNGGLSDGDSDQYYQVGLSAQYRLTRYLFAEAGYNYDKVNSDIPGNGYDRNRVFIGIGANY